MNEFDKVLRAMQRRLGEAADMVADASFTAIEVGEELRALAEVPETSAALTEALNGLADAVDDWSYSMDTVTGDEPVLTGADICELVEATGVYQVRADEAGIYALR